MLPRESRSAARWSVWEWKWDMSRGPEDPSLIALGAAISDGSPVDWEEVERAAVEPEDRRLLENLRDIAKVITAHRSGGARAVSSDAAVSDAQSIRHWRHLVLFEVVGTGAFGTVYRGWDSKLDREVAVKLLPKSGGETPSPLAEARNLARIRHSNVVMVHGADQDDERVAIWMEYIEGQTLAEMVRAGGPMSPREAAGIGIDLCRALSALHSAGLLHRDIKAHNVMREVGGRIVLMDFSGAQAFAAEGSSSVFSGTPLFMAPELFAGNPATHTSDVYGLGVLLFFLLTGGVPVDGATVADLKNAHARGARKRLRDLRADLPDAIVQVIERATAPDARSRYQTAGEFEHALAAASGSQSTPHPIGAGEHSASSRKRGLSPRAAFGGAMILLLLGTLAGVALRRDARVMPVAARFTIGPPYTTGSWPRVSPDGRLIVFGTIVEGRNRFWIRALDTLAGRPLMNTTANESPFWSPDSQTLAFFADGKLKKISVGGGVPEVLADAPHARGGDWHDRWIIFATQNGIQKVAPDGTGLSTLTTVDKSLGDQLHSWPEFLPDGKRFLYIIRSSSPERTGVYVASLDGGASSRLMPAYSRVAYGGGHLLFVREATLLAQPFDPDRATLRGQPVALSGNVKYHAEGDAAFDVSSSGVLILGPDSGPLSSRLTLFDRRGRELQALTPAGAHRQPRFSPDGQRIVAERVSPPQKNADLWVYDVSHHRASRLTSIDAPDVNPVWAPDGKRVAFSSKRGDSFHIFSKTVDGTAPETALVTMEGNTFVEHWSRDGRYLTATILRSGLWVIPLDSAQKPWRVRADTRAEAWQSEFSPDGRWLAYMSEESGNPEVYVEPFPATGARWQVSTRGGAEPHWRGDGRELFYLSAEGSLMATDVSDGGWQNVVPTPLFRVSVPDLAGNLDFTASPDGQTFVVNVFVADPLVPPIDVVVNWTSLLSR
jgi:eukaryotic-like serine/threonine-protein kinase